MFNEELLAEEIFKNGFINKYYNFTESVLVSKYFRHVLGYGDARIKTALESFCYTNDKFFNKELNFSRIKLAVSKSKKEFINKSDPIPIYQEEVNIINKVEGYKKRKVLFGLLVLCKKEPQKIIYTNSWSNLRHVLHSKITNNEISLLMNYYYLLDLIDVSYNFHKIKFIKETGNLIRSISSRDIYNLNKVFEDIFGKDLFVCSSCGESHERKSYNQKRCHDCSEIHKKEKWKIQKSRQRKKMSTY